MLLFSGKMTENSLFSPEKANVSYVRPSANNWHSTAWENIFVPQVLLLGLQWQEKNALFCTPRTQLANRKTNFVYRPMFWTKKRWFSPKLFGMQTLSINWVHINRSRLCMHRASPNLLLVTFLVCDTKKMPRYFSIRPRHSSKQHLLKHGISVPSNFVQMRNAYPSTHR